MEIVLREVQLSSVFSAKESIPMLVDAAVKKVGKRWKNRY